MDIEKKLFFQLKMLLQFACAIQQADALLTTDAGFFWRYFEGLRVISP